MIITIAGHLGASGGIPARVAEKTGYLLADRHLLLQAAGALGWTEPQAEAYDERTDAARGGLSRFLSEFAQYAPLAQLGDIDSSTLETLAQGAYADWVASPEMRPADRRYLAVVSALVRGLAERGDVVIVGRGSQAVLADHPDAVHVRVVCDVDERVRRLVERDRLDAATARVRIVDSDRERTAWHSKYFGVDYDSPLLYHLTLNASRLSEEEGSSLVVSLVRDLEAGRTAPLA